MIRTARAFVLPLSLALLGSLPSYSQAPGLASTPNGATDKAGAYFNFSMGHLYAELAAAYGNRGDYYTKAIDYYKQALKLDPSATFLLEELTDLYVQGNQLRSAVTEAEDLLKQNPNNLQARRMLGRIYTRMIGDSQQGKINEEMVRKSIEQYQIITQKDPSDIDSWLTLGRLQRVAQNSVEAEKAFKKAVEIDASNEDALTGLAMVYSDVGDTKNMIEMLRRVTDKSPNDRSLATLGAAYEQMRDYSSAAEVFKRALALKPDNIQIKRAFAQNLLYSEQYDEALKQYTELAEADPKDSQAPLRLSEIYRQKRMFDKAHAELDKAKQLDRDGLEVRYDEVNLLEAEGKGDEAITLLRGILDETAKKSYTASEKGSLRQLARRTGRDTPAGMGMADRRRDTAGDRGRRARAAPGDRSRFDGRRARVSEHRRDLSHRKGFPRGSGRSRRSREEVSERPRGHRGARLSVGRHGQGGSGGRRGQVPA